MTPEIKMVAVNSLVPYARNARTHSDAQVAQIAASIAEFGFTNPILTDGARGVIAGHGRLAAARKLALTDVPVIELSHLTAIQKKAYILADNRIAANAGWDEELLKLELVELDDPWARSSTFRSTKSSPPSQPTSVTGAARWRPC